MRWGDFEVYLVSDGTFRLDGGAMFGVVPRVIWEKVMPPDPANRIHLGLNCLLVRTATANILIDTGCGNKFGEKERRIYQLRQEPGLLGGLAALGAAPEAIDVVINTHLHFDHAGGNTGYGRGDLLPVFPNAVHFVQRQELVDADAANERTRASYFPENWRPLQAAGRLEVLTGEREILPGIICEPTPGHTAGHQSVRIESGGRALFFAADLCPTQAHVPLPWIMSYDLYPLTTLETRRAVYRRAVQENWLVCFQHDADRPWGRIVEQDGRYSGIPEDGSDHEPS